MIIVVWKAKISPGYRSETEDLWKRWISYDIKQPEVEDIFVIRPLQGLLYSKVMAAGRFSSLEGLENFNRRAWEDPEWKAHYKEWMEKDYFNPESMEQYIYEVIE